MITIFATPKHFEDIFDTIQKNALNSWRALGDDVEIIIFSDSIGSEKNAKIINAKYVPDVRKSESGVPYLSDLFKQARKHSAYDILTFINADIILPSNFLKIISVVKKQLKTFLMVGYRWDIDVNNIIDFNNQDELKEFWKNANKDSIKHSCSGIDYFVFNKNTFKALPDFTIGRPGYDNWLLWHARRHFIPLVDTSRDIMAIHQNHQFNLKRHLTVDGMNNKLIHGERTLNLLDANFYSIDGKVFKNKKTEFVNRNLGKLPVIFPEFSIVLRWYKRIYRRIKNMLGRW